MHYKKCFIKFMFFTALALLTFLLSINQAYSTNTLLISANVSKESYSIGEYVRIDGVVKDDFGAPVPGVSISIQVNKPSGEILHLGLIYSNQNGAFTHEFKVPSNAEAGTYIIYLTASKQGYSDATTQISCLVVPEFNALTVTFLSITLVLILNKRFKKKKE
ncbi:MAG: carboxypeptidase-like regulatory domain-containing protein [Candidatus Bathyarchaeia archaeon]